MKKALCAVLVLTAGALPLLAAPDSAYQALRTLGAQRGKDILNHVIEVEGVGGVPQPSVWRVVLDDSAARGGVREVDISHGQIVAEHTPLRSYGGTSQGALIDFRKLNLDSSGAFTVAEKEAQKSKIGFDSVNYTLRTGDSPDASPVWVVHMMDNDHHSVGAMTVAADTGKIVGTDVSGESTTTVTTVNTGNAPPPSPPPVPDYTGNDTDHDNLYTTNQQQPTPARQQDDSDTEDTQGLRIGHRIKGAILSAGQSLRNFVTGQSSGN